ncbi:sensor histidine kinase [Thalassotalea fusca]
MPYFLTFVFYLVSAVGIINVINLLGVYFYGLDFLTWWPLGSAMLFGLGGEPQSILATNVSGLSIDLRVPGLSDNLTTYWLTRTGLSLITIVLFLTILGTFRQMLKTVSVEKPFDLANIRRVQFIIALVLVEIIALDYWRTESMAPIKTLVDNMGAPIVSTNSSYQNADAFAYILLLLLLTLLSIFRRGLALYQEQKVLEEQLHKKNKFAAIGTLATGVGHDFNNILTSIIGYTEMAVTAKNKEESQYALNQVLASSTRAKRLTQQLRAIGNQQFHQKNDEVLDLKNELSELLVSIEPMQPDNILVRKHFSNTDTYPAIADSTKLYQVFLNLVTNAFQAMKSGGELNVDIKHCEYHDRQGFIITFSDSGCGISAEHQQKIFEPYYTTKHQSGGTGLGLAMCYSIVDAYKGYISVDSMLNKGSTFSVWLPQHQ